MKFMQWLSTRKSLKQYNKYRLTMLNHIEKLNDCVHVAQKSAETEEEIKIANHLQTQIEMLKVRSNQMHTALQDRNFHNAKALADIMDYLCTEMKGEINDYLSKREASS